MRFARAQALFGALALLLCLCAASPAAAAEPARVVLVRPSAADPSISEALIRIRGELVADGFDVELLDSHSASTPLPAMDDAGQLAGSAALIGLFLAPDGQSAELWVVDPLTHKTLVRRIDTRGEAQEHIAEVLAVRAVELLRASLLELLMSSRRPAAPAAAPPPPREVSPQVPPRAARPPDPPRRSMWGVELGGGLLVSPGGVGPALLPVARLRFAPLGPIEGRLSFAGLGTAPRVAGPQGSATVQQRFGLVELAALPWPELRLRPRFSAGLGALHVAVDGEASWPYRGVRSAQWAFAADAGAGVELGIMRRLDVVAEVHALVAHPYPVVRFVETEAARGARPALLGSLSLVGWL
ncbi:uncharacterized protein SOCE26_035280 [Sorangium cellulosum]|uniref:Secreted protein n=1 Tax=Sorangium cellulosum TaxID=56 RepID=A0A2L0ES24_SORCE|nr:hypothetical protein [Sorangium cellulosum]AUX42101.1 uncharacterized protein SOCE26_035280 [Sorangium cellulosum]